MTNELKIKLETLKRRVKRLEVEIEEDVPSILIKQEFELIQQALDDLKAVCDNKINK